MLDDDFRIAAQRLSLELETVRVRAGTHPGEVGTGAEGILRTFLQSVFPRRYSVGSGFIRDASGGRSHQMDVVVNDDTVFVPLPYDEGRNLYLAESVAAVIQVKTTLDSTSLHAALDNLATAMQLRKRLAKGEMRIMSQFDKASAEIIRCFVFAFDATVHLTTLRIAFRDYYTAKKTAPEEQANGLAVLNLGMVANYPPGYDKGGVKIGEEVKRGVIAQETEGDTLFHFLTHVLFLMPQVVYRPPVLTEYLGSQTYPTHAD